VVYSRLVYFLYALLAIPSVSAESSSATLKPKFLEASIALWVILIDGHPPIYPKGRPKEAHTDAVDPLHPFFSDITYAEHEAVADIIMAGKICTTRLFAQRTIGRFRALGNLRTLPHLSHLPSITVEMTNMLRVGTVIGELMFIDHRLEPTFIEEGAIGRVLKSIPLWPNGWRPQ
jgi:hypothetical protein